MRKLLAIALVAALPGAAALADDYANCAQDDNPGLKFAGCSALIASHPDLAAAYSSRGSAAAALGQSDRAIADYSRAIALDASLAAAYYNRALLRLAGNDPAQAADDFSTLLGLDPNDATAYNGRGMAFVAMGKLIAADADFAKAIALDPGYIRAYFGRADLSLQRGNFAAAKADYDRVLRLHPGDEDALMGLTYANNAATAPDTGAVGSITPLVQPPSPAPDLVATVKTLRDLSATPARQAAASKRHKSVRGKGDAAKKALRPTLSADAKELSIVVSQH